MLGVSLSRGSKTEMCQGPLEGSPFSVFKLRVFVLDMAQRNRVTKVRQSMKASRILPLAIAALLAGCSSMSKSDVYTYRSDIGGPGMDLIVDNELDSGDKPSELIWLNALRVRAGAWKGRYYLEVRYEALPQTGWVEIGPGETLVLTVDGQPMKFGGIGSVNERKATDSTVVEHAIYEAKADDIRKIARAKEVKVDIVSRLRTVHREFKPANIDKFKTFVLTYMGF